jgi:uncharacterized protein (TIGR03663 family)
MNNEQMTNEQMANGERRVTAHAIRIPQSAFRITLEVGLWAVVAVVALALRLYSLDAAPLDAREAHEASLAWRAVARLGMPAGAEADYSPVLLAANALVFTLCAVSDSIARLWPALMGALLALTPCLFRQRIGRVGALAAGSYLAFSPSALFASRHLDGTIVAAAGVMVFLGGLLRFFDTEKRSWLTWAGLGLALVVTSSPAAYGLLLTMGLAFLVLVWAWPGRWAGWWGRLRPHLVYAIVIFVLAGLALATGLGWNLGGLGATGDLLGAWLARFGPAPGSAASPLLVLAVYEPLALLLGLGGLVWAVRHGHRLGIALGLWAGLSGVLLALMRGRAVLDVTWVLLPAGLLAGLAAELLVRNVREQGEWITDGLYVLVVVVLWAHFYVVLAHYAVYKTPTDMALALLTVALQVLLAMVFALGIRVDTALRALGVGTIVALVAVTLSAAWGSAYVRPGDPRELLAQEPAAPEVRDLVQTLRDLSWRKTGMPTTLSFTLEAAPGSVLAWYLRDFSAARQVEDLGQASSLEGEMGPLVTTRRDLASAGGMEFVGQDFALRRRWNPAEVRCTWSWPPECSAAVEWYLFRRTPAPPAVDEWAVLWVKSDQGSVISEQ